MQLEAVNFCSMGTCRLRLNEYSSHEDGGGAKRIRKFWLVPLEDRNKYLMRSAARISRSMELMRFMHMIE
jgi:hypothetical protein